MRGLNRRTPRIAGLLALALGAVALLAVSGIAMAKDHGNGDNGNHGRHHHHGRDHNHFEMREAGTISSFDPSTGKLTIALVDGGTLSGLVTESTEIKCEGVDNQLDRRDHGGGGDNSGPGSGGDDNTGRDSGDDNGGQSEPGDDNGGRGEPEPGDDNGGEMPPVGTPAPAGEGEGEGETSCSVASLVPGAFVGKAELRRGDASAVFEEIELGHHS
jgi:hypothetical protein